MSDLTGDVPAGYVWEEDVLAGAIDTGMAPVNACRRHLSVGVAEAGRVDYKYRYRCRIVQLLHVTIHYITIKHKILQTIYLAS